MEPIKLRVLLAASCGSELSKKFDYYYQNELTVPAPCDDETGKASTSWNTETMDNNAVRNSNFYISCLGILWISTV